MPDTWLINFTHQLPQRNQLCLNQLTLLCISLQQDVRRSALQKIAYCTGFMYWPIVIIIIWKSIPLDTKWEQSAHSTPSKCEKIRIIHLLRTTKNSAEEQLATVAVLVSTGRILIRGMQYKEWSETEFPVLVHIINSIEWIPPCPSNNSFSYHRIVKIFPTLYTIFLRRRDSRFQPLNLRHRGYLDCDRPFKFDPLRLFNYNICRWVSTNNTE